VKYTERLIKRKGQPCEIISRTPTVISKCITAPSTKAGWRFGDRDSYVDGITLLDTSLTSGEVVLVSGFVSGYSGQKEIIVMAVNGDPIGQVISFLGAKATLHFDWQQQQVSTDANYNVIQTWANVSTSVPAYGQTVTAALRQSDPGLLPTTKYLLDTPSAYDIKRFDRIAFNGVSAQVDDLDKIILDGIIRLQCSEDTRV